MTDPTPNDENAIAVIPQGTRYEDALWELIFEIWLFFADRNCVRTREKLLSEFRDSPVFDDTRVPSVRQIQYKAKQEAWHARANELIRQKAPEIDDTHFARLLIISDEAINVADRIIKGEYLNHPKPGNLAVMADMVKEMLKFRGLGTAAALATPTFRVEVQHVDTPQLDSLTTEQMSEMMRQAILSGKETKRLTGKTTA
jgi:hypothetical protein